jgi:radical SAM superfamily enzyme YgiQ (UPF0313 family)
MGCSFCATKLIEGTHIRRRSPESIAQWVEQVAACGFRNFCMVDNTFNIPPSYAKGPLPGDHPAGPERQPVVNRISAEAPRAPFLHDFPRGGSGLGF